MKDDSGNLELRLLRIGSTTLLVLGIMLAFAYCLHRLYLLWENSNHSITLNSQVLAETTASELPYAPLLDSSEITNTLSEVTEAKQQAESIRQQKIDRVEAFFDRYGAKLKGYGHVIVDKAEECGGDYKILVGIAGSESGLGRIMYKKYNPYGYLDGVQYKSQKQALQILSCRISEQHIAPCGQDLNCLARRYAGPQDDTSHFVNKVRWFMDQI